MDGTLRRTEDFLLTGTKTYPFAQLHSNEIKPIRVRVRLRAIVTTKAEEEEKVEEDGEIKRQMLCLFK